jgi:hypothetical protein
MPAYNADKTREVNMRELPDLVDICILVDQLSRFSDRSRKLQSGCSTYYAQRTKPSRLALPRKYVCNRVFAARTPRIFREKLAFSQAAPGGQS